MLKINEVTRTPCLENSCVEATVVKTETRGVEVILWDSDTPGNRAFMSAPSFRNFIAAVKNGVFDLPAGL